MRKNCVQPLQNLTKSRVRMCIHFVRKTARAILSAILTHSAGTFANVLHSFSLRDFADITEMQSYLSALSTGLISSDNMYIKFV